MKQDLALLLRSLPHLRPTQVPQRAARLAIETGLLSLGGLSLLRGSAPALADGAAEPSPRLLRWRLRPAEAERVAADAAVGGFEFLGLRREFGPAIQWEDPTVPRLWRFALNAFDVAWAFAAAEGDGSALAALVAGWHRDNPPRRGDPWHPFVVAERLINLLGTRDLWLPHVRDPAAVGSALWGQARFLRAALERDVGGNHLVREAVALLAAGQAFGHEGTLTFARSLLLDQAGKQILADGVHAERSPSYHLEVMTDLAEARTLLPRHDATRERIQQLLERMAAAAVTLCHPDGQVAMFNDATFWPVPVDAYLDALGLKGELRPELPDAGYFVLGSGPNRLVFDAGPPSPPDLPPHAHCDLLSVELSLGGTRMIVNSGTGDYERGPWREYWRSTRAHNTVEVGGQEQSEVWHSFRMARRASPSEVTVLGGASVAGVSAAHDGYRHLRPQVTHRRTVVETSGLWLIVDSLEGAGRHAVRSFLHLHPGVEADLGQASALLTAGGSVLRVVPLGALTFGLEQARLDPIEHWHAEHLGERRPGRALSLVGVVQLPAVFGWLLRPGDGEASVAVAPKAAGFVATIEASSGGLRVERDGHALRAEAAP
jgi:uncharacterized heparinase superfamily protein